MQYQHLCSYVGALHIFAFFSLSAFDTLQQVKRYAETHEESVVPDNRVYLNSDYTSIYRRYMPSWWQWFKQKVRRKRDDDQLTSFKKKIETIVESRRAAGYLSRHVVCLQHAEDTAFVVWGDLRGAFHSFVRGLLELHAQGILGEDLVLTKPNVYVIINANAVGNAPWNLELLDLLATLMLKNPQRVVYVKGAIEDRTIWADQSLMRQINVLLGLSGAQFGFASHAVEYRALERLLSDFFDTLPLAVYVDYVDVAQRHNLVRFSGTRIQSREWDEQFLGDFFQRAASATEKQPMVMQELNEKKKTTVSVAIRSLVISLGNVVDFEPTQGLIEAQSINGATVWSIFSAPTDAYRLMNGFFYDAFVMVQGAKRIEEATITLYNRDVRTTDSFQKSASYLLVSGIRLDKAQHVRGEHEEIVVGASIDLSKGLSAIGKAVRNGATARLEQEHRTLQPEQRLLRIVFLDDEASPRRAFDNVAQIQEMFHTSVICFALGESLIQRYLQDIRDNKVLLLFPIMGSPALRSEQMRGALFFRPAFDREVRALMKHAFLSAPGKRFCFFYQDDELGNAALQEAKAMLKSQGIDTVIAIPHVRNATSFQSQVEEIKKHDIDALFFFSFPAAVRAFIQQVGSDFLVKTDLYGFSLLGDARFKSYVQSLGLSLVISQAVPNPKTSMIPLVQAYRTEMDVQGFVYDPFSLEGYITTALLIDAVQHIKGPVTTQALEAYFAGLKEYPFQGFTLTFNPERRDFNQPVWLDIGSDDWEPFYG